METKPPQRERLLWLTHEGADLVVRALLLYEHSLNLVGNPRVTDASDAFWVNQIITELATTHD